MNSYLLQRINLYGKLNIKLSVNDIQQACCTISLTDEEMFMLDETFTSLLSKTEESTLYYLVMLLSRIILPS